MKMTFQSLLSIILCLCVAPCYARTTAPLDERATQQEQQPQITFHLPELPKEFSVALGALMCARLVAGEAAKGLVAQYAPVVLLAATALYLKNAFAAQDPQACKVDRSVHIHNLHIHEKE